MKRSQSKNRTRPTIEHCEDRALMTLIFVLNGASFTATGPDKLTANAAAVLHKAGNQVVQLSNPTINTAASFEALAKRVVKLAHGQRLDWLASAQEAHWRFISQKRPDSRSAAFSITTAFPISKHI